MADTLSAHPAALRDDHSAEDALWQDALRATAALWLFVLLIYLPAIVERHSGEGLRSIALDSSTIFVSMLFALPLFALFRSSVGWPLHRRVATLGVALILIAISQAVFDLLFTSWVTRMVESSWAALPVNLRRGYAAAINYVSVFGVNLALFQLAYSRRRSRRLERGYAALLATGQRAELEALRFRSNPHFVFNTLNAISAMIVTGRTDEADRTVERLAAFLRASNAYDPATLIPLDEELSAVEHYARIEEMRFRDRIGITMRCEPGTQGLRVPPLMVQLLMEGAIDAASMAREFVQVGLTTRREGDLLLIEVSLAPSALWSEPAAIALLHERFDVLFGHRAGVKWESGRATLWLPANTGEGER